MTHLKYDLIGKYYSDANDKTHPVHEMNALGITCLYRVPQSMGDCWEFFCCENIPENLPPYITEFKREDIISSVGFGLSEEMAKNILKYGETK